MKSKKGTKILGPHDNKVVMVIRFTSLLLVCVALNCFALYAHAEIYVYVGPDGERLVSDRPLSSQPPGFELLTQRDTVTDAGHILAKRELAPGTKSEFLSHVAIASRRFDLDPALVEAVIYVESGFDPNAVSHKGATGLMQLMKGTAQAYHVAERHDPRQNIYAGTEHLALLLDRFGTLRLALAAYNAGAGAVERYNGVPPYPETERYIEKVLARLAELERRSP